MRLLQYWRQGSRRQRGTHMFYEHIIPLLIYAAISVALTWPLAQHFTTRVIGQVFWHDYVLGDVRTTLWSLWHVQQFLLGHQPAFTASTLYYPYGISLFLHGIGALTLNGFFALPFWWLGPVAAYNGSVMVGFWLTGYCMYLLARGLQLGRSIALFAGITLLAAQMHLAGLYGHLDKVTIIYPPLILLVLHYALERSRSRWWTLGVAPLFLLTILHSGDQFIYTALATVFFMIAALIGTPAEFRRAVLGRCVAIGVSSLLLVSPVLAAMIAILNNPLFAHSVHLSSIAGLLAPDLLEFFIPSYISVLFGPAALDIMQQHQSTVTTSYIEGAVSLSWVGLGLCVLAVLRGNRLARRWVLFTAGVIIIALGPYLKVLGTAHFTAQELPIILPFAFLSSLPGLGFIRTPGRSMMIGYIGFGIAASFGLSLLVQRLPRYRVLLPVLASILVLVEAWPKPWPTGVLPPAPSFYRQIAADTEMYGVLDLPIDVTPGNDSFASIYQIYQMTHRKGIAWGYISRSYDQHPQPALRNLIEELQTHHVQSSDILYVNGRPANRYANARLELARAGYRYLVLHKALLQSLQPVEDQAITTAFIRDLTGQEAVPQVDDQDVQVYRIDQTGSVTNTLMIGNNWYTVEGSYRWAASPATLKIDAAEAEQVILQIQPVALYDPAAQKGAGSQGTLIVQSSPTQSTTITVTAGQPANIPLTLLEGSQTITLTLQTGNFQPLRYGSSDARALSFALSRIDLRVADR